MSKPTLSIIIVNWNAGNQLRDCIASIASASQHSFLLSEVFVVDNGSKDGSLNDIESLGVPVNIILNETNRGFAAACNQGAVRASGNYLLFLNPDMRLFENSLDAPVAFMQHPDNSDVGIVGIQLVDKCGVVARSCSRLPLLRVFLTQALGINRFPKFRHLTQSMDEWPHDSTRYVDQVIGAFFLMRRSIFVLLGGFDERFFVYFEEVDLSYRAHQAGLRSIYLTEVQAFHAGCGTSNQVKAHRLFYSLRSRILYGFKHFTYGNACILFLLTIFLEPISRVFFSLIRGHWCEVKHTLQGYWMLICDLHNILRISK
jgi:GT2 family glycosyltransferase